MRRGLNNKGFTLVELLAVVVILALVMGIAASNMLSTMNSSRKSTLHSAAQTAATNLNNWIVEDMLATSTKDQVVGNAFITYTQADNPDQWLCLDKVTGIKTIMNKTGKNKTNLLTVLGLSSTDINISTVSPEVTNGDGTTSISITSKTCSALKYNSTIGGYEFFLNAKSGGKYFVASEKDNYAFSRATGPNVPIK